VDSDDAPDGLGLYQRDRSVAPLAIGIACAGLVTVSALLNSEEIVRMESPHTPEQGVFWPPTMSLSIVSASATATVAPGVFAVFDQSTYRPNRAERRHPTR
jgi:hypothetical protein